MDLIPLLFFIALFFNIRASFKLALDWRGMLVTTRFVRDAYARLGDLSADALRLVCGLLDSPLPPELSRHYVTLAADDAK